METMDQAPPHGRYGISKKHHARLQLALRPEDLQRFDAAAKEAGLSRSGLLERWIERYAPPLEEEQAAS